MSRSGILGIKLNHPAQIVVAAFAVVIFAGTLLLLLPFATTGPGSARPITALFTATSAVCVTGLITVDTATYWSGFGQVVILVLIQLGGFGIMTLASLAALFVSHKLGLKSRLLARAETGALDLGDVRSVLLGVIRFTLVFEVTAAVLLALRFWFTYDEGVLRSIWLGVFHAVSAFNNAGFALFSDNLIGFADDPMVLLVIVAAVVAGGLGFPVWLDLRNQRLRWRKWTLHTRLTVVMTVVLLVAGTASFLFVEWDNPDTIGPLGVFDSTINGIFGAAMPRTAGFNAIDYGAALTMVGYYDEREYDLAAQVTMPAVGEYVAPATTLEVTEDYVDADGDGAPSIGETAEFSATVTNEGAYALTGLALGETAGVAADALAADASIAAGASLTWNAEHVITAADFAAGTVAYGVSVDADGLETLTDSAAVGPVAFAAFETDLEGVEAGGIVLCTPAGDSVSELERGDAFTVRIGSCDGDAPAAGSRVFIFSEPVLLGDGGDALTVPTGLELGDHRVALYGADGALVGWAPLSVVMPVTVEPTEPSEPAGPAAPVSQPADDVADPSDAAAGDEVLSDTGADPRIGLAATGAASLLLIGMAGVGLSRLAPARARTGTRR